MPIKMINKKIYIFQNMFVLTGKVGKLKSFSISSQKCVINNRNEAFNKKAEI